MKPSVAADIRNDESQLPETRPLFAEFGVPDSAEIFAVAHISGRPELQAQLVAQMFRRPEVSMANSLQNALADFSNAPVNERFDRNGALNEGVLKNQRDIAKGKAVTRIRELFSQMDLKKIFGGSLSKREALIIQTKFLADLACGGFPRVEYAPANELNFITVPTYGATPESLMTMAIRMVYEAQAAGENVDDLVEILREIKDDIFIGHMLATTRLLSLRALVHIIEGNGRAFIDMCRAQFGEWMHGLMARVGTEDAQKVVAIGQVAREADMIFAKLELLLLTTVDGGGEMQ